MNLVAPRVSFQCVAVGPRLVGKVFDRFSTAPGSAFGDASSDVNGADSGCATGAEQRSSMSLGGLVMEGLIDRPQDDCCELQHVAPGCLSLSHESDGQSSVVVSFRACPDLDEGHTVVGQLVEGAAVLKAVSQIAIDTNGAPFAPLRVTAAGNWKHGSEEDRPDKKRERSRESAAMAQGANQEANQVAQVNREARDAVADALTQGLKKKRKATKPTKSLAKEADLEPDDCEIDEASLQSLFDMDAI